MSEELLIKFAKTLQEQREKKGFSLQQISAKTRIDIKFLKAIESGNFDVMPEVYMRAFIKDYSDVVELDVGETLNKYEAAKSGKSTEGTLLDAENVIEEKILPKAKMEFVSQEVDEKPMDSNSSSKQINPILITVAIVLVILLVVYFLFMKSSSTEIIKEKPFNQVLNEKQRFATEPVKKAETVPDNYIKTAQNAKPFSLTLVTTDTVWLRLRIDNEIDKEFILKPNEEQVISANDSIKLLVGNLGGIKFILNDKSYDFKGVKGQVQNLQVNRNGIKKIKVKQIKIDE